MIKRGIKNLFLMYGSLELFVTLALYMLFTGGFYYFLTNSSGFSVAVGVVFGTILFYILSFRNKVLRLNENRLNSILKYVTDMIFYLQLGDNVKQAYQACLNAADKYIKEDLEKTLYHLNFNAELVTNHFKVYGSKNLNQFHDNLRIKYLEGGDAKEMFTSIQRNILYELKKRDQLLKRKTGKFITILFMLVTVTVIPVFLSTTMDELWTIYIAYHGDYILLIYYVYVTITLHLIQKNRMDISVRT